MEEEDEEEDHTHTWDVHDHDHEDEEVYHRDRGQTDDTIWFAISGMHLMLWNIGGTFFLLSLISNWGKRLMSFYIKHLLSNFNIAVYIASLILLTIDAFGMADAQAFSELAVYALLFSGAAYIVELTAGVGAL